MSVELHEDPKAKERSLMLKQKPLCSGQRTGRQCVYYWALRKKTDTVNPDTQRKGETIRYCTFDAAEVTFLGDAGCDMAVACTGYTPSERVYDESFESFTPMQPEEIIELERKQLAGEPLPEPVVESPVPGLSQEAVDAMMAAHLAEEAAPPLAVDGTRVEAPAPAPAPALAPAPPAWSAAVPALVSAAVAGALMLIQHLLAR